MYKRILLKLSGEQLQGDKDGGFDAERAKWIAAQIKPAVEAGTQVAIIVGGGNYARGAQLMGNGIVDVTAHNAGMLATIINAITLADVFNAEGLETRALSNITVDQFIDRYTYRRADNHLQKQRVVVIGGGTGRPFVTTDTAAVNLALELKCDAIIKTTKVDGVYDKDPVQFADARRYDSLTYDEALASGDIQVMDKAALGMALEDKKTIIVCKLLTDGNIARAAAGESVGTVIR
ncbi:UMP kinase [Candidatus Saccharibacteria bacterium]|nr:MAG: UMP kinase [Candidatus Saccharibacteria bacterium]